MYLQAARMEANATKRMVIGVLSKSCSAAEGVLFGPSMATDVPFNSFVTAQQLPPPAKHATKDNVIVPWPNFKFDAKDYLMKNTSPVSPDLRACGLLVQWVSNLEREKPG